MYERSGTGLYPRQLCSAFRLTALSHKLQYLRWWYGTMSKYRSTSQLWTIRSCVVPACHQVDSTMASMICHMARLEVADMWSIDSCYVIQLNTLVASHLLERLNKHFLRCFNVFSAFIRVLTILSDQGEQRLIAIPDIRGCNPQGRGLGTQPDIINLAETKISHVSAISSSSLST